MNVLTALLAGLLCGFGSSAPPGPINLWVADSATRRLWASLLPFLCGVLAIDMTWAALAHLGAAAWLGPDRVLGRGLSLVGGVVLLWLGSTLWRERSASAAPATPPSSRRVAGVFQGMALCAAAPALPAFWVLAVAMMTQSFGPLGSHAALGCFLLGIAIGDLLWFSLLFRIVRSLTLRSSISRARGHSGVRSVDLRRVHRGVGALLIVLGISALVGTVTWAS